jgi:Flp pilus assembly protein TadG
MSTPSRLRQKGVALIYATLTLMIILPLVGLAVDVTTLYLLRTKLLAATDAAVLAGARALGTGSSPSLQILNAQTAANRFFAANFPAGFWGTRNINFPTVIVDDSSTPNYRTVTANATVEAPLMFLRVLGQDYATIAVESQSARRDALVVVVLDRSVSMTGMTSSGQTACDVMKQDALLFVDRFAEGRDQLGLVTFGSSSYSLQSNTNFAAMRSQINQISCYGNTNSSEGMHRAYEELQRVNNPNRVNVVVFMTDGRPNGFTGMYPPMARKGGCAGNPATLEGTIAQWANGAHVTGATAGIMRHRSAGITDPEAAIPAAGCTFPGNLQNLRNDVNYMPVTDSYGNATEAPYSTLNFSPPYNGNRTNRNGINSPREIVLASTNTLDNQATVIRNNLTLTPSIYTIGLKGNGAAADQPDDFLLRKLANDPILAQLADPGPTVYSAQRNEPKGIYVEAPTVEQLQQAFDLIATHILVRLSR